MVHLHSRSGGGNFDNGTATTTTVTDSDGRASARFTLGFKPGMDSHRVTATLVGTVHTAGFTASALVAGDPGATSISGTVLDNQDKPLPAVTIRVEGMQRSAVTDSQGQFTITQVPVGPVHLITEGSTTTTAGEWPTLSQNIITVAGANNTLPAPIYMIKLDTANAVTVGDVDVDYTLANIPGFKLSVKAGSVTFPDGSKTGQLSVTAVNASKVPMAPPNGMQPQLIVTIQPTGAVFDPPAPLSLPNVDAHAPGAEVEMYSFDHDLEEFVAIGLGTVSKDGSIIESNTGVGVVKAGWHCGSQPARDGDVKGSCIPTGKIQNHVLRTSTVAKAGIINISLNKSIKFDMSADLVESQSGSCAAITYEWRNKEFGNPITVGGIITNQMFTEHKFTKEGVYTFTGIARTNCACPIESIKTVNVIVGGLEVVSSSDPESAAVDSFYVGAIGNIPSSPITVTVPVVLVRGETIDWKVEALESPDGQGLAYGGVTVKNVQPAPVPVPLAAPTGEFQSPWLSAPSTVTALEFNPNPPSHLPSVYGQAVTNGAGTTGIDVHQRNPRLGYKITATLNKVDGSKVPYRSVIVQMDEKDMIRQEYINHLVSAPSSALADSAPDNYARVVKVPTRLQLKDIPAGDWVERNTYGTQLKYSYKYFVSDGIEKMWADYQAAWNNTSKTITLLTIPSTTTTLSAGDGIHLSSAYRNPERQEFYSSKTKSLHMMGRALDIAGTGIPLVYTRVGGLKQDNPTFERGLLFKIAWKAMSSTAVTNPYWDFWQLEGRRGAQDLVRTSSGGFNQLKKDDLDNDGNGVLDGYERTGHLHLQDDPTIGGH